MSDTNADSCLSQKSSPLESTKTNVGTMQFKSSQTLSQSIDSDYEASKYIESNATENALLENGDNHNMFALNMEISLQSVECRAAQMLELAKNGAFDELQKKIIYLLTENDELKSRLKETESNGEDFCIDAVPSQFDHSISANSMQQEAGNHINYDLIKGGENVLSSTPKSTDCDTEANSAKSSFANCCFNCLGSHVISDCKEPKDYKRINQNRRSFQSQKGITSSRYHVEEDQKFGHIQPGQPPSRALMKALGLKDDRYLPPYIYQMRKLGYPPAWLKYAQINREYRVLFDILFNLYYVP